jgi:hypothetical protein
VVAAALLGEASAASAATKTWLGTQAGTLWCNTNNWSPSGLPGTSDDVVLTSGNNTAMIVDQDVAIASFTGRLYFLRRSRSRTARTPACRTSWCETITKPACG